MKAICVLTNVNNTNINGYIEFEEITLLKQRTKSLKITLNVSGLTPGYHGFHVHKSGDLRKGCGSLCGHFNPDNTSHGDRNDNYKHRHAGDLGNIKANKNGIVKKTIYDKVLKLSGKYNIIGRSVVIHANPDDLGRGGLDDSGNVIDEHKHKESIHTGNAGARIACGVIGIL